MDPVAKKLRYLKETEGVSYEEIAVAADIRYNTLKNVWSGRPVSYKTLIRLEDAKIITKEERIQYERWREAVKRGSNHKHKKRTKDSGQVTRSKNGRIS